MEKEIKIESYTDMMWAENDLIETIKEYKQIGKISVTDKTASEVFQKRMEYKKIGSDIIKLVLEIYDGYVLLKGGK